MNRSLLLIVFSMALSGCILGPDDPTECATVSSCDACIELAGCGWCPGLGCVGGTVAGPSSVGLSCQQDYRWDSCQVRPDPCRVHGDADLCALASGCAWCPNAGDGCRRAGACPGPVRPPDPPTSTCTNTCRYAFDGACDDGGNGAEYSLCEEGTDCGDCGPR